MGRRVVNASPEEAPIREQLTQLMRDQRRLPIYTAGPDSDLPLPGLILVHEIFGLTEHIKDVARRFARQGLRVYAPDLFAEADGLPEDRNDLTSMRAVWQSIPDSQLIGDLKAVLAEAISSPSVRVDAVGTLGYCMGGAIAFMFACEAPEIRFVVDYYGRIYYPEVSNTKPRHPVDYAAGLHGDMLGLFAGIDELITSEHIEALEARLKELGKTFQIVVYKDAPHAFFNDRRPNYRPDAAADAWERTIDFIRRSVRS